MEFERRKAAAIAAMMDSTPDKSPKGTLDAPIIPLLDAINRHPSYFTTSSCSGRITILCHPRDAQHSSGENKTKKKAGGGRWLLVTHSPADPDSIVDLLFRPDVRCGREKGEGEGSLVFRFEPLIIAVDCRDSEAAQSLVATAISSGFRESGITSLQKRVMVAIRCSIRLEVPLGDTDHIMVSPEYVRYLVGIANEKMEANKKRTDGFFRVLLQPVLPKPTPEVALKELDCFLDSKNWMTYPSMVEKNDLNMTHTAEDHRNNYKDKVVMNDYGMEDTATRGDGQLPKCGGSTNLEPQDRQDNASCDSKHKETPDHASFDGRSLGSEMVNLSLHNSSGNLGGQPISVMTLNTVGEPVEKLLTWGQSACTSSILNKNMIYIFGGFGGIGRHERRNDLMILDHQSGLLKKSEATGSPGPRLAHTASMVGDKMFIIGGRCGPLQVLNDIWIFDTIQNKWRMLEYKGNTFSSRHRHAAATVGENIYIFGGLNDETVCSSMHVLNTITYDLNEIKMGGQWPCARHSHSMVGYGSHLFLFGGHDGEQALGDLCSFNVKTLLWKDEQLSGRAPSPRFSHSMFVYKDFLGIIGGCPLGVDHGEVNILDLSHRVWRNVKYSSAGRELWIRSSAVVIGDDLIILGGGSSCYAFGTKFNQPTKVCLHSLTATSVFNYPEDHPVISSTGAVDNDDGLSSNILSEQPTGLKIGLKNGPNFFIENIAKYGYGPSVTSGFFGLQIEKKYAKLAKDVLKQFGWLDTRRKVESSPAGLHINLPLTSAFIENNTLFPVEKFDILDASHLLESFSTKNFRLDQISPNTAVTILLACGSSIISNENPIPRNPSRSPKELMLEAVSSLIDKKGLPRQLLKQLPARWERLGDIAVLPMSSFKDHLWKSVAAELWPTVAKSLGAHRLARQGRVLSTGTRDSTLEMLVGDSGWVTHHENGITYSFDATKCMFSAGNLSEKLRMARLDCKNETIVDLFAGIGYFVLPFLVKAKAKLVYACEWNPHALEALRYNVEANGACDRCIILEGDNRVTAPEGVADRVCLGLLPSSEGSWLTAVKALKKEGGVLHVHGNVNESEESTYSLYVVESLSTFAKCEGYSWHISVEHLERVKWYAPHIRHVVVDVRCKQQSLSTASQLVI